MRSEYSAKLDSLKKKVKERRRGPNSGIQEIVIEEGRGEKKEIKKRKRRWSNRKSKVRWRLWLRGWLQISTEGFPSCCLQLADHTLRGWRRERKDKDLTSLSFPLNPLFSLPVCLRLSLRGLRLTCWPILNFPAQAGRSLHLSLPPPLSFHPALLHSHHPSFPSSHSITGAIWDLLVWPSNTTAQICSVSLCISYLLCLTSRDKPVFITLSDLFSKSVHTQAHTQFLLYWMSTNQP